EKSPLWKAPAGTVASDDSDLSWRNPSYALKKNRFLIFGTGPPTTYPNSFCFSGAMGAQNCPGAALSQSGGSKRFLASILLLRKNSQKVPRYSLVPDRVVMTTWPPLPRPYS